MWHSLRRHTRIQRGVALAAAVSLCLIVLVSNSRCGGDTVALDVWEDTRHTAEIMEGSQCPVQQSELSIPCPACLGASTSTLHLVVETLEPSEEVLLTNEDCDSFSAAVCLPNDLHGRATVLVGNDQSSVPCWYGRWSYGEEQDPLSGLFRFSGTSSLSEEFDASSTYSPSSGLAFPNALPLPDGRVLFSGGLQLASYDDGEWRLGLPSKRAQIWDPQLSELRGVGSEMNVGRALHAAIYVPQMNSVLMVGGVSEVAVREDPGCFPWIPRLSPFDVTSYTFEVFDCSTEMFVSWDSADWEFPSNEMALGIPRVLPALLLSQSGEVLVVGGAIWEACGNPIYPDAAAASTELFVGSSGSETSPGFLPSGGPNALATRVAPTASTIVSGGQPELHLVWGGTIDAPVASVIESPQLPSSFMDYEFAPALPKSSDLYTELPFFHSFSRVGENRWLLAGGIKGSVASVEAGAISKLHAVEWNDGEFVVQVVSDLFHGRYFHSATRHDDWMVFVGGVRPGLEGLELVNDVQFFNVVTGRIEVPLHTSLSDLRGPLASTTVPNGCGVVSGYLPSSILTERRDGDTWSTIKSFCPSILCPESLWEDVCHLPPVWLEGTR